jgi:hypothetical protein
LLSQQQRPAKGAGFHLVAFKHLQLPAKTSFPGGFLTFVFRVASRLSLAHPPLLASDLEAPAAVTALYNPPPPNFSLSFSSLFHLSLSNATRVSTNNSIKTHPH